MGTFQYGYYMRISMRFIYSQEPLRFLPWLINTPSSKSPKWAMQKENPTDAHLSQLVPVKST